MFIQEFKRGVTRKAFILGTGILVIIMISSFICSKNGASSVEDYINIFITKSSYYSFLPCNIDNGKIRNIIILLMPFITSLAYADSYLEDKKKEVTNFIYTRVSKNRYLLSKYSANFVIGGLTIFIPLVINFIILIMFLPSIEPHPIIGYSIVPYDYLFANIYYSHPIIYILLWMFIYFLYGGAFSSISLGVSTVVKNKIGVLSSSFIILTIISIIIEVTNLPIKEPTNIYSFGYESLSTIVIRFLIIVILSGGLFFIGGRNDKV